MRARELPQLVEVGRVAGEVHGDDGPRPGRELLEHARGVEGERVRPHVGEDRRRPLVEDGIGGRREGERRDDRLVSRAEAGGEHRRVERRGPRGHGDRVAHADPLGDALLELLDARPRGEPVTPEALDDRGHIGVVELLAPVGEHPSPDRWAAVEGEPLTHQPGSASRRP